MSEEEKKEAPEKIEPAEEKDPEEGKDFDLNEDDEKPNPDNEEDDGIEPEPSEDDDDEEENDEDEEKEELPSKDSESNSNNARRRVNTKVRDLQEKLEEERAKNDKLLKDAELKEEEGKARSDLASKKLKKPVASEFDLEAEDPKYVKALEEYEEYREALFDERVDKKVSKALEKLEIRDKKTAENEVRNRVTNEHYQRVEKSGNKNYDKEEKIVIDTLGARGVASIIGQFEDAHIIISNLSKSKETMEDALDFATDGDRVGLIRLLERNSIPIKKKGRKSFDPDLKSPGSSQSNTANNKKYKVEGATFT